MSGVNFCSMEIILDIFLDISMIIHNWGQVLNVKYHANGLTEISCRYKMRNLELLYLSCQIPSLSEMVFIPFVPLKYPLKSYTQLTIMIVRVRS